MLALSILIGALSGFGGMYVSYYGDIASGATITLFGAAVFAVVYLGGMVRHRLRRAAVGRLPEGEGSFVARARSLEEADLH